MSDFWKVTLDPGAAYEGTGIERAELSLNSGPILIEQAGADFGEAAIEAYMAQEKYGNAPVSYRVPNRTVTIPLGIGMKGTVAEAQEARRHLEQKVGLLQREGGVLLREREGNATFLDVVTAKLLIPDKFGASIGVEPNVLLTLECLPDFYGAQETLDTIKGTGTVVSVLKASEATAVLAGDLDARAECLISTPTNGQNTLIWGVRSRYYDSAETAKLAYNGSELTPVNGAEVPVESFIELPAASQIESTWQPFTVTDLAATKAVLTHIGTYRVLARVYTYGLRRFRLKWDASGSATSTTNPAVTIPARRGYVTPATWLLDLGTVTVAPVPIGERFWRGSVELERGTRSAEPVRLEELILQPLDDANGRLESGLPVSVAGARFPRTAGRVEESKAPSEWFAEGGTAWANPSGVAFGTSPASITKLEGDAQRLYCEEGAAVPTAMVPESIEVSIDVRTSGPGKLGVSVWLVKEGVILNESEPQQALLGGGGRAETLTFGGNLWGTTWTVAELNATNTGFLVFVSAGESVNVEMSNATMTIVGPLGSVFPTVADRVIFPGHNTALRFDDMLREDEKSKGYVPIGLQYGDLLRLPPSGMEQRPVEIMVRGSRGRLLSPGGVRSEEQTIEESQWIESAPDAGLDELTVEPSYWPSYIGRI